LAPIVWESIKKRALNYPVYSHEHPGRFDENGNPYVSHLPMDLFRNYDEVSYRVLDRRLKAGR